MSHVARGRLALTVLAGALAFAVATPRARASDLPSPLRANDVIVFAREHRAEITSAYAKANAAAELPKIVSALPDPMLMGSIDHMPYTMPSNIGWSVMIQQDFPLSGILGAQKRAAEAKAGETSADAARVILDVEAQALEAFLMRVEVERMTTVVDEQRKVAEEVLAATNARIIAGDANAADVVRAEVDVARLAAERIALDSEAVGATAMLNAALGRKVDASLPPLEYAAPTADPAPLPQLVQIAYAHRPELASMKAEVAVAEAKVDQMDAMYTPMAFVRVGTSRTVEMGQGLMLMVGVSIPLWREKLDAGVNEAKSMVTMAESDVAAMKRMIEGDVGAARALVTSARARYVAAHDSIVPLSSKAVTLTLASYAGGQSPLVSVLDAVRALREARMQEIVAEIEVARAWAKLGRAIGEVRIGP